MPRSKYRSVADFVACVRSEFAKFPLYEISTDLNSPTLELGQKIAYKCACKNDVLRTLGDVKKGCANCKRLATIEESKTKKDQKHLNSFVGTVPSKQFWKESTVTEYFDEALNETWKLYPNSDLWVSNKGRLINIRGNSNIAINEETHKVNLVLDGVRTGLTMFKLICTLFDERKGKLLQNHLYVARLIDSEKGYVCDNMEVMTKGDLLRKLAEETSTQPKRYISEEDLPQNLREVPKGLVTELPDHWIFSNGLIYNRLATRGGNKFVNGSSTRSNSDRKVIRIINDDGVEKTYYIDILVLMIFSPIEGKQSYDDYKDVQVIYKNNNIDDCYLENLSYKTKLSEVVRREQSNIQRINLLQGKIAEAMKVRNAKIITDLDTITAGTQPFSYKCGCGIEFERCFNDINGKEGCMECENKILEDNLPSEEVLKLEVDGTEQEFARCDCGWVSANYTFLNNKLQKVAVKKDQVCLGRITRNARHQLAKAFKVPNYERLGEKGWIVAQKNSDYDVCLANIEVTTQSELVKKKIALGYTAEVPKGLEEKSSDKEDLSSFLSNTSIEGAEEKTHPLFPGIAFYSNGVIKTKNSTLTRGVFKKCGYLNFTYNSVNYKVHRLICLVFNPLKSTSGERRETVDDYMDLQVDHINRIKHDNSAKNLRWVTASENINYGVKMNAFKANKPLKMYELNKDGTKGKYIKDFATQKECASELKMSPVTLLAILRNQRPQRDYFIEKINKE